MDANCFLPSNIFRYEEEVGRHVLFQFFVTLDVFRFLECFAAAQTYLDESTPNKHKTRNSLPVITKINAFSCCIRVVSRKAFVTMKHLDVDITSKPHSTVKDSAFKQPGIVCNDQECNCRKTHVYFWQVQRQNVQLGSQVGVTAQARGRLIATYAVIHLVKTLQRRKSQ